MDKKNLANIIKSSVLGVLVFASSSTKNVLILAGVTVAMYFALVIIESQPFSNIVAVSAIGLRCLIVSAAVVIVINVAFQISSSAKEAYSRPMIGEEYAEMFAAIKKENVFRGSQKQEPTGKKNELEYVRKNINVATAKTTQYVLDAFKEPVEELEAW